MLPKSSAQRVVQDLRVELFRRRISQEKLATTTKMSQSTISRRLNGEVSPTIDELERIAAAGGLDVTITLTPSHDEGTAPVDGSEQS